MWRPSRPTPVQVSSFGIPDNAAARSGRKDKRQKNPCWAAPLGVS